MALARSIDFFFYAKKAYLYSFKRFKKSLLQYKTYGRIQDVFSLTDILMFYQITVQRNTQNT